VHLDAIETGLDRIGGCLAEILDDAGDFRQFERARGCDTSAKLLLTNVLVSARIADGATGASPA